MTTVRGAGATDVGRVRQINEDRFLVEDGLFVVADGVGGHQAGEVAAQTAVEAIKRSLANHTTEGLVEAVEKANEAVWQLAQTHPGKRGMGTTLTAVAVVNEAGQDHLAVANVGDSRAYLFQKGELMQLTEDHSLVEELVREGQITAEEAQVHPQRSIITRALGMEPRIEVDSWQLIPYRGDRILLCTDGLTNEVSEARIASTLRQLADPDEAAHDLVRQARANGGSDNATVVVLEVVDDDGRSEKASIDLGATPQRRGPAGAPLAAPGNGTSTGRTGSTGSSTGSSTGAGGRDAAGTRGRPAGRGRVAAGNPGRPWDTPAGQSTATAAPPRLSPAPAPAGLRGGSPAEARSRVFTWRVAAFAALLVAICLVAVLAVAWYARSAYFVGLDGERVAIYRGRPGGLLWFEPTLQERKPLTAADVLPSRLNDLRAGKEEPTKADADRYVNNLRQEAAAARTAATPPTTTPPTTTPPPPTPSPPAPSTTAAPHP